MCAWIIPPVAGLIEPSITPEFYIDCIGAAEILDSCIRYYLCAEQMPLESGAGPPLKVVTMKIVAPISVIPVTMAKLAQCMVGVRSPDVYKGPRLVR